MAQIQKKFIAANSVDEFKVRFSNNAYFRARNAADSADIDVFKVDASDRIVFASVPQVTADAVAANDVVRFSQFAGALEGLKPKAAVKAASPVNIDLAVAADPSPVDGVTLVDGDRVLLWQQTSPAENGIYVAVDAADPTSWTRSLDFDAPSEIPGAYTVAQEGTLYQGVLFVSTSSPGTIGVDPIVFADRSIATYSGGDMVTVSSNVISVDLASTSGLESTNPGNAAGQLRVKLEASNPTIQIDGSNQLGVKLDAAGAIVTGASGLKASVDNSTIEIATNALQLKAGGITNSHVNTAAAIAYSKLALTNSIVNADVAAAAAIAYSKLALTNSIVNADIAAAAAIAYSKLNLATSIVNADISASAAIAYSKLDLAAAVKASDMNSQVAASGAVLTADGAGAATYVVPAAAAIAASQQITLNGTDITNQYIDLAQPIRGASATNNSLSLAVSGGPMQLKGVDYTVSLTGGAAGVTRISFAGDLATAGSAALVASDVIMVNYTY